MPAPTPGLLGHTRFDQYDGRGSAYRIHANLFPTTSLPDSAIITQGEGNKRTDSVIQPVGEERTYITGPGTREVMPLRLQVMFQGTVGTIEDDFNSLQLALDDIQYLERDNWWRAIHYAQEVFQPRYNAKKRVITATFMLQPIFAQWTDAKVNTQSSYDAAGKRWNKIWSGFTPGPFTPTIIPINWQTEQIIYFTDPNLFRYQLEATGGNNNLVFSKVSGHPEIGISSSGDILWATPGENGSIFTVQVSDGNQTEERTFTLTYAPDIFRPEPPTQLVSPTQNETTADITWENAEDVLISRIYLKLSVAPEFPSTFITKAQGIDAHTLTGLLAGTSYDVEVRSFKDNFESISNPSVSFETLPDTGDRNYLVDSSGNPYVNADGDPYFIR